MTADWSPPRCSHGRIILACPDETCLEQNAYLDTQNAALAKHYASQQAAARRIVRSTLGLPAEVPGE